MLLRETPTGGMERGVAGEHQGTEGRPHRGIRLAAATATASAPDSCTATPSPSRSSSSSDADKSAAEEAIADVKLAIESGDAEAITAKSTALAQAAMKLGEALYKNASGQQSEPSEPRGTVDDDIQRDELDDIMDAEFEEVKDDENKKA